VTKFILRRILLMLLTMFMVSVAVFAITSAAPGNVARNVLGIQITPTQEKSFLAQNGLDKPMIERYFSWLVGTDWRARARVGLPMKRITTEDGFTEWWAEAEDGSLVQWKLEGESLIARHRQPDGTIIETNDDARWQIKDPQTEITRLEQFQANLEENNQLTHDDRQAIARLVGEVIGILNGAVTTPQSQAALLAVLNRPESELTALRDPQAAEKKQALQKAAGDIPSKEVFIQALVVAGALSAPTASELNTSNLQFMAGQINRAAVKMKELDPETALVLQQAYDSLKAGDIDSANLALAKAGSVLDRLTGNLGALTEALKNGDYQQAANFLGDFNAADAATLNAVQLAALVKTLQMAGDTFEDADPVISESLQQAATNLEQGDVAAAQAAFDQAAASLSEIGYDIARSDAAGKARVGRTFWGVDGQNHAVRWETGSGEDVWVFIQGTGWKAFSGGPAEYIPLQKGLLRGDPGISLRTGRPVADLLYIRLRNSLVLAGAAFVIVMPIALVLGIIAGLNQGRATDRALSIGGMMFSVMPEFAMGIFLILIFAFWLDLVPGATVFGEMAPWQKPEMLILPIMTLTMIELGYVLRITRASMVDVMKAPYIRTAFLKGLPYKTVVMKHAVRNALMAPITVIMLHVNWLLGGIVVVEVIFGYPGLGSYLLDSALFKDFNAIEAGAMILVVVAVVTQLLADIIYTIINPRIRYS
jgi:ABC-type dipeptide/oligopeptide/nickel transport system permease component